jgi:hypothetical protein
MDTHLRNKLEKLCRLYGLQGSIVKVDTCDNGHINDTYRVILQGNSDENKEYIFQRINSYVFKDPVKVMENIRNVSLHVQSKRNENECDIISFLDNLEGKNYTFIDDEYWRVCVYVKNSVTFNKVTDSKMLYNAGIAFGQFHSLLSDMPIDELHVTIPDFHNTKKRMTDFFRTVSADPLNKAKEVKEEVWFFEKYAELACKITYMQESRELPLRVVHNDTKYNNILMDERTLAPLCVIDLDTVMSGLSVHDFGDAIRFAANTAEEDEVDLSKVSLDMELYKEFSKGYLHQGMTFLTPEEIDSLALGAFTITVELASRFLADYINGDKYFRIHRYNHNLDRARCQIKLAKDMFHKMDEMRNIINESMLLNGKCRTA